MFQLLNLLDVIIDYAESKQVPAPEESHVQISTTEKGETIFVWISKQAPAPEESHMRHELASEESPV